MNEWDSFLLTFRESMEAIFYPDTLEEWLEENVNEHIERLSEMVVDVERIIALNGQPKADPLKTRWKDNRTNRKDIPKCDFQTCCAQ